MPNVVRFTLSTARDLYVLGAGQFIDGVLDVDVNDLTLLSRTRYLVVPYGATEIGIVDSATPYPSLPAVPVPPPADPYPQYLDPSEVLDSGTGKLREDKVPERLTEVAQRAAFGRGRVVGSAFSNGTTDATAHIQSVIDEANANGEAVIVPPGDYKVTAPLENVHRMVLPEGARIFAGTAGMAAVVRTAETTRFDNGSIVGQGTIDAGTNAAIGVHLRNFLYYQVDGIEIRGGNAAALKLGSATASGRSAEAVVTEVRIYNAGNVVAGSRGILVENSGDHAIGHVLVNNYDIGVDLPAGGNAMLHDVHPWTEPAKGAMTIGFRDRSNNSHYSQCHADTPTQFGFQLFGYQTTLVQCGTYINPTAGNATDNIVVGVRFESPNPIAAIVGHFFLGGSATKRLKADIEAADGNYGLVTVVPIAGQYTVTVRAMRGRMSGLDVRDHITTKQRMVANPDAPSASAGLVVQTGGVDRWSLVTDGAAESGSNVGTGLRLVRHGDDGAVLGEVFYVARSGTWVQKSNMLFGPGANLIPDAAGTKIGTAATNKWGFWGAAPVSQPQTSGVTAGHTAGTGAAVTADSTFTGSWGTTPYTISDIISNLKQAGIIKS